MKDTVFSEREASSAEFNEREASSILRGSGLAGDELHRRRHRSTVVRRVARREVDAEHRDGLRKLAGRSGAKREKVSGAAIRGLRSRGV